MALMDFREPNQVKWVGTRPAHNGEQVSVGNFAENATVIVYNVSAGKILYLCTTILSYGGVANGVAYLFYRDAADLNPVYLATEVIIGGARGQGLPITFYPPLEIPTGYDICVRSNVAGLFARGYVYGWVE